MFQLFPPHSNIDKSTVSAAHEAAAAGGHMLFLHQFRKQYSDARRGDVIKVGVRAAARNGHDGIVQELLQPHRDVPNYENHLTMFAAMGAAEGGQLDSLRAHESWTISAYNGWLSDAFLDHYGANGIYAAASA